MRALTHDLNIGHNTWHYRWYHHWLSLGGKPAGYKENLCRYVRVLVVWAPLRWFFRGRIGSFVPPWAGALALGIGGLIASAFATWTYVSLLVLAIVVGVLLAFGLFLLLVLLYNDYPQGVKKVAKYVTLPIWLLPYLAFRPILWTYRRVEKQLKNAADWFLYDDTFGVSPLGAIGGVLLLAAFGFFMYLSWWKTLAVIGFVIGVILLLIFLIILTDTIGEWWKYRRHSDKPRSLLGRTYDGVADTVKLGATYIGTKKRGSRICPFIDFENPHTE